MSGWNEVIHATNAGGFWATETVEWNGSGPAGIAVAADGTVHIVYRNPYENDLVHAWWDGFGWLTEPVDGFDTDTGYDPSVAIDGADALHVSYWEPNEGRRYANNTGGFWVTETFDDYPWSGWSDTAVDGSGGVHTTYWTDFPRYAMRDAAGDWTVRTVIGGVGVTGMSVAVEADDDVHFTFGLDDPPVLTHGTLVAGDGVDQNCDGVAE